MTQIHHLLQFYPRENVHVMILERWAGDPKPHYDRLLEFAGLEPMRLSQEIIHMRHYTVEQMDEQTRQQLIEIYQPENEKLFEWLGERIDEWDLSG